MIVQSGTIHWNLKPMMSHERPHTHKKMQKTRIKWNRRLGYPSKNPATYNELILHLIEFFDLLLKKFSNVTFSQGAGEGMREERAKKEN